jgi:hypothetical protein
VSPFNPQCGKVRFLRKRVAAYFFTRSRWRMLVTHNFNLSRLMEEGSRLANLR